MIISPPYLLPRNAHETDEAWIRRCMPGGAPGDGSYPLSHAMQWHGGLHLTEPEANAQVRAIADGEVVFCREPSDQPIGSLPPDHAQAYGGGWTDTGVVILKHTTEIGEGPDASVTFFSIYMHLREIDAKVKKPKALVYRKAPLGRAGSVFGATGRLHLEIVCDDTNLRRLVGRTSGQLPVAANGRADALYGSMYFRLPTGTPVYDEKPMLNNPVAHRQPTRSAGVARNVALQAVHTTTQDLFVGLRYAGGEGAAGNRGDAYLNTCQLNGTPVGDAVEENDAEYNLYRDACAISNAYPANGRPAPSAVYELLRFGRVIGPDALNPLNVPHWRRIHYPGGTGWVNLNAANVNKFSDADFPHWMGWSLVDDSADLDSRCDSNIIKGWLDVNGDGKVAPTEALARMSMDSVAPRLARAICKFPTEWSAASFDRRLGWIKTSTVENPTPVDGANFERMRAHIAALAFWPGGMDLQESHWHWNPREFIGHFRKCGWLSIDELASTFPKHLFYTDSGNPRTAITTNNVSYTMTRERARTAISNHHQALNFCLRKYVGANAQRMAVFLAQVMLETAQWRNLGRARRLMHEWGFGAFSAANPATKYYSAFYGRGIMQLTWAGNYARYGEYRQLPSHNASYVERLANQASRIAAATQHYDFNPADGGRQIQWFPRYDPDIVAEQPMEACDSGGFYWVSKPFSEGVNINRVADRVPNESNIGLVNRLVNGGGNGYYERQAYTAFILRILTDSVATSMEELLMPPRPKASVRANMARTQ